ncbi:MAG: hypothetical protein IPP43_05040 [Chitinophagaceae bacterium]|nr:hypothetical protein [Chitinophagaceae bacterium]
MKKIFFLLSSYLLIQSSFSQYDPGKISKKAIALYTQAQERALDDNYTSAAGLLLQAIEADKKYVEAYLALASIYGKIKNYNSSTQFYEKAFALDTAYTLDYKLPYSVHLAGLGAFEKALIAINELLTKSLRKIHRVLKWSKKENDRMSLPLPMKKIIQIRIMYLLPGIWARESIALNRNISPHYP